MAQQAALSETMPLKPELALRQSPTPKDKSARQRARVKEL